MTITILSGHENLVVGAAFSPDGQRVITGPYGLSDRAMMAIDGARVVCEFHIPFRAARSYPGHIV
jgi:hypothetical protein